jgi:hypothetical protein
MLEGLFLSSGYHLILFGFSDFARSCVCYEKTKSYV